MVKCRVKLEIMTYYSSYPPPPHNATDACGSGGSLGNSNDFVTYTSWQSTYFTGCNYDDLSGNDQFISVCDPDMRDIKLPRRRFLKYLANGRKIISPSNAVKFSNVGLEQYKLIKERRIASILRTS
jgi:hypothetical protein